MRAFKVTITVEYENSTDSESIGLAVQNALSTKSSTHDQWILDSGATYHMYKKKELFTHFQTQQISLNVILGDG